MSTPMFVYLTIDDTGDGDPVFKLIADDRTHEYFSATPDGLRKLGRFMAHKWPDRNVSCSSSLDYPWEYGVDIDPDDIVKYITEGVTEIQP